MQSKTSNVTKTINELINRMQYSLALNTLEERSSKKDGNYYISRMKIFFGLKEFSSCLKDADKCIQLGIKDLSVYHTAAKCCVEMFDLAGADSYLNQAKALSSGDKSNERVSALIKKKKDFIASQSKKYKMFPTYVTFMNELYKKGAFINKLTVNFDNNSNRSVVATESIDYEEVILKIPLNCLISLEVAQDSDIGKYFTSEFKKSLNSPNHCLLTSFLLTELEKGEKSEWAYYFNMLPESYDSFPIFFSEEELAYLKDTIFMKTLVNKKKEIKQDYDSLCKVISYYKKYSYEEFCKVRMIISSRIFGVKIKNVKTDILAPYADMLNHKRPRETHWNYEDKDNAFVVSALTNIPAGNEVFDSYGKKCNSRFLLNYGFAIEDNEDNEYKISISLTDSAPLFEAKSEILKKNLTKKFSIKRNFEDDQNFLFLSFLRFIWFEGNIKVFSSLAGKSEIKINPISVKGEIIVLNQVKEIMKDLLGQFKTTLEEDNALLYKEGSSLTFNQRNCILIRKSEKEILKFFIDLANYGISYLKGERSKRSEKEDKKNSDEEVIEKYIKSLYKNLSN